MTSQRHIIKRQVLDLQISSDLKAFELQNKISDLYRREVISLIESFCDQMSEPDQIYRIDSLQLDLGSIDPANIELDFIQKVKIALDQELSQQRKIIDAQVSKSLTHELFPPNAKNILPSTAPFGDRQQLLESTRAKRIHSVDANLELFRSFLETGNLPWWSEELDQAALCQCLKELIITTPNQLRKVFQNNLKNVQTRQRIIWQFPETTQLEIIKLLAPNCNSLIQDYLTEILLLKSHIKLWKTITENKLKQEIWHGFLFQLALSSKFKLDPNTVLQDNLFYLADRFNIEWRSLVRELTIAIYTIKKNNPTFSSQLSPILRTLSNQREGQLIISDEQLKKNINNLIELFDESRNSLFMSILPKTILPDIKLALKELEQHNLNFSNQQLKDLAQIVELLEIKISPLEELRQASRFKQISLEIQTIKQAIATHPLIKQNYTSQSKATNNSSILSGKSEEIYIQNSGLILLSPFLNRFFESLHLVQSGQFLSPQSADRAILILQYLVDGSTESLESRLPLNKLLCGVTIANPIPYSLALSSDEKNECEELLGAVIQHWSALKKISINSLRQSFLQRNGVLRFQDEHFLLQVEHKTHDILIEQIPWSISIIKLPFMSQVLHVEW